MDQVQNGYLYIRYRSSSMKNKANKCKKLTDHVPLLFYCSIHFISSTNLSQSWENQMWNFLFCSPSFLVLLCPSRITQKLYDICKYCTYQTTALLLGSSFSGLELRASYGLKTLSKDASHSHPTLWGLLFTYSELGTYSQATPGLLTERVCYRLWQVW